MMVELPGKPPTSCNYFHYGAISGCDSFGGGGETRILTKVNHRVAQEIHVSAKINNFNSLAFLELGDSFDTLAMQFRYDRHGR